MKGQVYDDDGRKVRSTFGRPPKPSMTDEEFEAVQGILRLPKGTHGSSLERAALEVSLMRGLHSATDPRTRKSRTVSGAWVSLQLAKRGFAGKRGLHEKLGTVSRKHEPRNKSRNAHYTGSRVTPESYGENRVAIDGENFVALPKETATVQPVQVDSAGAKP